LIAAERRRAPISEVLNGVRKIAGMEDILLS
jgi:hypothetical protein